MKPQTKASSYILNFSIHTFTFDICSAVKHNVNWLQKCVKKFKLWLDAFLYGYVSKIWHSVPLAVWACPSQGSFPWCLKFQDYTIFGCQIQWRVSCFSSTICCSTKLKLKRFLKAFGIICPSLHQNVITWWLVSSKFICVLSKLSAISPASGSLWS